MMVCSDTNGVSPVKVSASTGCSSETDNKSYCNNATRASQIRNDKKMTKIGATQALK